MLPARSACVLERHLDEGWEYVVVPAISAGDALYGRGSWDVYMVVDSYEKALKIAEELFYMKNNL